MLILIYLTNLSKKLMNLHAYIKNYIPINDENSARRMISAKMRGGR